MGVRPAHSTPHAWLRIYIYTPAMPRLPALDSSDATTWAVHLLCNYVEDLVVLAFVKWFFFGVFDNIVTLEKIETVINRF